MRNSNAAFQIDYGDLSDSMKIDESTHFNHDFVDPDLYYAYYHYHVGCIFNLYYFNNFDYYRHSRYFHYFFECHFNGHFCDFDLILLVFVDDHLF